MRKFLAPAMAAVTLAGTLAATATPADARPYGYYGNNYRHDYRRNDHGDALAAGVVGLALGAALASSSNHNSYYSSGYAYPRYRGGYARPYGYGYRTCESQRWAWDPYIGRRVLITSRYAC